MVIPDDDAEFDNAALGVLLGQMIDGLFELGVVIDQTDHLSDRECYRWLVGDELLQEMLFSVAGGHWNVSPIGGGSDEDIEIYLRYYADEEERQVGARLRRLAPSA